MDAGRVRMGQLVLGFLPRASMVGVAFYLGLAIVEVALIRPASWFALEDATLALLWLGMSLGARQGRITPLAVSPLVAALLTLGGLRIVHEGATTGIYPLVLPLALLMVTMGAVVFSWGALLVGLAVLVPAAMLVAGTPLHAPFLFQLMAGASVAVVLHLTRWQLAKKLLALHDATERRAAALVEAQALASLVRWDWTLPEGPLSLSAEGRALFGLPDGESFTSDKFLQRVHPDDRPQIEECLASAMRDEGRFEVRFRYVRDDGVRHLATRGLAARDATGRIECIWGITQDVTESTLLAETLRRQERLSALGTLVAGVAHEINNPLAYMVGAADLTKMDVEDLLDDPRLPPDVRARLHDVRERQETLSKGAEELASLSRGLKLVAKQGSGEREPVELSALVADVLRVATPRIPPGVEVRAEYDAKPSVVANRGELTQVVLNLLLNAADAMRGQPRGTLLVRVEEQAGSARVVVRDTGPGVSASARPRLFTPFFTTKPEGTGLGLSISHSIIEAHGGSIDFESEPGRGAEFRVRLPAVQLARAAPRAR